MRRTTLTTALAVAACLAPAAAARADTAQYGYTGGEQVFTVPTGVSSIQVVAVGGRGGRGGTFQGGPPTVAGGFGARVTATLAVSAGQVFYVEVGGNGANGNGPFYSAGGFNGGGDGGPTANGTTGGGAGGGATDLRMEPRSAGNTLNSRVLIAAGGGGGGAGEGGDPGEGVGGAAGADGGDGDKFGQICEGGGGGQAAGGLFPGAAGTHSNEVDATPAPTAGAFGVGGKGGSNGSNDGEAGGGGGGGRAGGGGGGASTADSTDCDGGGGGGGSSFWVPQATEASAVTATSATPRVEITYTVTPTGGGGTGGGGTGGGGTGGGGTGGGGTGGGGTGGGGTGGGGTTADPLGPLAVKRIQRGTAIKGSAPIGFANSSFRAELYGNSPRYGTYPRVARRVLLGRVTKTVTSAGKYAFTVRLNKRGKRALKRRGKLKLVLRVAVTPQGGGTEVAKKNLTLLKPRS